MALLLQARGRARAKTSVYSVLAKANSQEVSRELLNEDLVKLMERAIRAVQAMPEEEYRLRVRLGAALSTTRAKQLPPVSAAGAQPSVPWFQPLALPLGQQQVHGAARARPALPLALSGLLHLSATVCLAMPLCP